jgi:hypothetical protein
MVKISYHLLYKLLVKYFNKFAFIHSFQAISRIPFLFNYFLYDVKQYI